MATFPLVNGQYYSFSDISLRVQGLLFAGVKTINYKDNLSRAHVRGAARVPLGLSAGRYQAEGSIEMYPDAFNLMVATVSPIGGWRQIPFSISVTYGPNVGLVVPLVNDIIPVAYLGEVSADNTEGDEPLTRKFTLIIPGQILWNGVPSIIETSTLLAVA